MVLPRHGQGRPRVEVSTQAEGLQHARAAIDVGQEAQFELSVIRNDEGPEVRRLWVQGCVGFPFL